VDASEAEKEAIGETSLLSACWYNLPRSIQMKLRIHSGLMVYECPASPNEKTGREGVRGCSHVSFTAAHTAHVHDSLNSGIHKTIGRLLLLELGHILSFSAVGECEPNCHMTSIWAGTQNT